jgi:hypothetical protein
LQSIKEEGLRLKLKRTSHLSFKIEKLFKRFLATIVGDSYKKEFIKSKAVKKKAPLLN